MSMDSADRSNGGGGDRPRGVRITFVGTYTWFSELYGAYSFNVGAPTAKALERLTPTGFKCPVFAREDGIYVLNCKSASKRNPLNLQPYQNESVLVTAYYNQYSFTPMDQREGEGEEKRGCWVAMITVKRHYSAPILTAKQKEWCEKRAGGANQPSMVVHLSGDPEEEKSAVPAALAVKVPKVKNRKRVMAPKSKEKVAGKRKKVEKRYLPESEEEEEDVKGRMEEDDRED